MAPGENEFDTPVLNPLKEATAGLSEPPGPTLVSISLDSLLGFTWESPRPAQVAAISACFIAQAECSQAKHRWGLTLAGTTQKPQSLSTQWTATHHIRGPPPSPCTTNPSWRVEVGGKWSQQSLQLTGLGKFLPLICLLQLRLNNKRRVYSSHMKGVS